MSVQGPTGGPLYLPTTETVDAVITDPATGDTTAIWLSQAPLVSGSISLTFGGGGTGVGYGPVDGGSKIADNAGTCFTRVSAFTGNVREWGASCDVQVYNSNASATWQAGSSGYLNVPNHSLPTNTSSPAYPYPGEFIAISQIGPPPAGPNQVLAPIYALPASTVSVAGDHFTRGDVVAFDSPGSTTVQLVTIVVDSVSGGGSQGPIATWHFLWGGQYSVQPSGTTLSQYTMGSHIASGNTTAPATFTPVWSGWTIMSPSQNGNTLTNKGTGYSAGDLVTFTGTGGTVNQSQDVQIVVENVDGSGEITNWHFANFGSYATLPSAAALSGSGGTGNLAQLGVLSGTTILPPIWSNGTLATTISNVVPGMGSHTEIQTTDNSQMPSGYNPPINVWYYGHDDGYAINQAIQYSPGGADVILPADCGTTREINLPTNGGGINPALRGLSTSSSGLYAFGSPNITPMNHVVFRPTGNGSGGSGGGLKDIVIEGLGIPEGSAPNGYDGTSSPQNASVVEIDVGGDMHFDNIFVKHGFGSGNSDFQCAPDDADPTGAIYPTVGPIWVLNSRMDEPDGLSGAYSPDYDLELTGCHDSYFTNINAFDATVANIRTDQNHFLSPHVNSQGSPAFAGANPTTAAGTYAGYPGLLGYPGVASWGFWVTGHSWITDTQCDAASIACIFQDTNPNSTYDAPSNIFGLKMDCNGQGVSSNYYGVELGAGAVRVNIMGVGGKGKCNIPPAQLIHSDGALDPSIQIFGNSTYPFAQLTLPAFTQPQGRLSLTGDSVMTSDVSAGTTVYYWPYVGTNIPVWNGQMYMPQNIGAFGLSLPLNAGVQAFGNLYDIYAGLTTTGGLVLCTGPAWYSSTSRSPTVVIVGNYQGVWVNKVPLTCTYGTPTPHTINCAALFCTYLGTMYATAPGTTAMQFGPNSGSGGPSCTGGPGGNFLGLWNAYNRVHAFSAAINTNTWAQTTASTWEPANVSGIGSGLCNRVTFVDGLAQSNINTVETQPIQAMSSIAVPQIGVVLDSATATPLTPAEQANVGTGSVAYSNWAAPLLGLHYAQAMENAAITTSSVYRTGLSLQLNWEY
jgi:hypothetical protein